MTQHMLQQQQQRNDADRDRRNAEHAPRQTAPTRAPGDDVHEHADSDDDRRDQRDQADEGHAVRARRSGQLAHHRGDACRRGFWPFEGDDLPRRGVGKQGAQQPIVQIVP